MALVVEHVFRHLRGLPARTLPPPPHPHTHAHTLCPRAWLQVLKLLVRKGAPVDVKNKKGWTPLHRAAYNGRREAVHCLIQMGASLAATTQDGNTALHLAAYMNQ